MVYATYAPPPINMPTSFPWESGAGFQPDKQDPPNFHGHGVTGTYKQPSIPQSHSDIYMSTIDKWMWDADQAKPQSEPGVAPPSATSSVVRHQIDRSPSSMASSSGILSMRISRAKTPPRYGGSISSGSSSITSETKPKLESLKSESVLSNKSQGYTTASHSGSVVSSSRANRRKCDYWRASSSSDESR